MTTGKVLLVGAGPGDPGLLTDKGRRALSWADAIVYDRLASPRLLAYAKPDVELIYVGKAADAHTMQQADIEEVIIALAKRGRNVVRLKGGDPFVFGRGGEEANRLSDAGIEWEVVPGVTSAVAVPAYAGIPVTYRNVSPSFTVVTGHRCADGGVDWNAHAKSSGTLVILMGVSQLPGIVEGLVQAGKPRTTPIALVRWGTRSAQQTLTGTLEDIVDTVRRAHFASPAVIVVGEVVTQRASLAWYENLPLQGRRIFIATGTTKEALVMAEAAEGLGAETHILSSEHIGSVDAASMARVISSITSEASTSGVYFRTSYGVELFFKQLQSARMDVRALANTVFGASDAAVSAAFASHGIYVSFVGAPPSRLDDIQTWWFERVGSGEGRAAEQLVMTHAATSVRLFQPFQLATHMNGATGTWLDIAKTWLGEGVDAIWTTGFVEPMLTALAPSIASDVPEISSSGAGDEGWTLRALEELDTLFWRGVSKFVAVEAL